MMSNLGKYGRTFGFIFGAAFFVSGINSIVASNTNAPSIAKYSITHDFAERLWSAMANDPMPATMTSAPSGDAENGVVIAVVGAEIRSGS